MIAIALIVAASVCGADPELAAHERAQDELFARGSDAELREMLRRYARLRAGHPDDLRYLYLHGRAFLGRGTPRAIAAMEEVLERDARFAPAHRTLAAIHGSKGFADPQREAAMRSRFLALCPGGEIAALPLPLPPRQAVFANGAEATPAAVEQALHHDAERLIRIQLFDWYSPEEKKRAREEMKEAYWSGWTLMARHYERTGEREKAAAIYTDLERRRRK